MTLKDLEIGKSAVITSVGGKGALRQHFLDMGMIPGAEVTVVKFAPSEITFACGLASLYAFTFFPIVENR